MIQEQILAHSSTNKNMTLDAVLQFVQVKEAGKSDSNKLIKTEGGLCRISDFKKNKIKPTNLASTENPAKTIRKMSDKCNWCGETGQLKNSEKQNVKPLENSAIPVARQIMLKILVEAERKAPITALSHRLLSLQT